MKKLLFILLVFCVGCATKQYVGDVKWYAQQCYDKNYEQILKHSLYIGKLQDKVDRLEYKTMWSKDNDSEIYAIRRTLRELESVNKMLLEYLDLELKQDPARTYFIKREKK